MESLNKNVKPIYSTNVGNTEPVKKTKRSKDNTKVPLRRVDELPAKYRKIFLPYTTFNIVQSSVFECLLATDSPVVVSSPTGSGKTVLFELAIVRLIETCSNQETVNLGGNKIVYLAPVKALCSERYSDWTSKFRSLGIRTAEVTGDSTDLADLKTIENLDLILTTPEKWDSMTRRWRDHAGLVQLIKLFLIDEVHLLNEERRGPTLEAVVSRMKAVEATLKQSGNESHVRFVAASATIPNINDIAQWLGTFECPARFYKFDESMRPVNLKKIVLGYPLRSKDRAYTFELCLTYKLKLVIQTHANGKPTLIFCSSRKSVQQTCNILKKTLSFNFTHEQKEKLEEATSKITDNNLRELVKHGLGYHHAGLLFSDRQCLEDIFRAGYLPVLISTSTLAMGVNLPAHLVIIKSTEHYVCGEWQPYSESQILQMMGRAGRPQFDTTATAVIMTRDTNKAKYDKLMSGEELVESSLHNHLVEHLNSEIVLGTITDIAVAMNWLRSTFLYIRAIKNPKHYGMPLNLTEREIESKLQAMCMRELHALEKYELLTTSNFAYSVEPTENGKLMARYYIAFETMKVFMKIEGTETLPQLLELLTHCHEFQEVQLRRHERPILNSLNRNKTKESIRFPIPGKITAKTAKANVLIQAVLGSLLIPDAGLLQESVKVMRLAERLLRGLTLYLGRKPHFNALSSALTLHKCTVVKMWENSALVSRQLPGIGPALGALLVSAGKKTFLDIVDTDPRTLERIINRQPPMGNTLQEAAQKMPHYDIDIVINEASSIVLAHVQLLNPQDVQYGNLLHKFSLLISAGNKIMKKEVVSDQTLILQRGSHTLQAYVGDVIKQASEVTVTLISQSIVGVDVQAKVKPKFDHLVQPLGQETSPVASPTRTSKPQPEGGKKSKQKEPTKVSRSLEKYSFQPMRSKKLISDKTERNSASEANDAAQRNSKNACSMKGSITETLIVGEHEKMISKSKELHQTEDDLNCDIIEILSSSSSGKISELTKNGVGKICQSKNLLDEMKSQLQQDQENYDTEKSVYSTKQNKIIQRSETNESKEPAKSKEDFGFDIDELFHSSSLENLPDSGLVDDTPVTADVPVDVDSSQGVEDGEVMSKVEVRKKRGSEPLNKPLDPRSLPQSQRLDLPLTYYTANLEDPDQKHDNFNAFGDQGPSLSQEDDLNDLFFEMCSEDVKSGGPLLEFSQPSDLNFCTQFPNTDAPSRGFKFNEIPRKLRVGYNEVPTNSAQSKWKSTGTEQMESEHQINQVAQEFIATQSIVSQTFTAQFSSSQPYAQFQSLPDRDIHISQSKAVQNIRLGDSSGAAGPSIDPRSLESAVRVQSTFASPEPNSQNYALSSYNYVPHTIPFQIAQPYAAPSQTMHRQFSTYHPVHCLNPQTFGVQNEFSHFYNYSYSPLHDYRIPATKIINPNRPQAISSRNPQTPLHTGMVSRGVSTQASAAAARQPLRDKTEPIKEKLIEVLQYSEGHTQLPTAPAPKRRRTSTCDTGDSDSGVGRSVCTSLSSLMAIHGGYSKSLSRNDFS